jgi:predicted AlkP superfamily pyrophosphatase or phosphodiesterase
VRPLRYFLGCALLLALTSAGAVRGLETISAVHTAAPERPILILVSIDGWRWDYLNRFAPAALSTLAARGVLSEGLIPGFPSKTFPNHYTMVTGLYPDRHGIVSNTMLDPALPGRFSLSNVSVQQDTRWWGGVPLWVTAEQQGRIAATMFWPGSDVEIAGDRPTLWRRFDNKVSNNERVDQILAWLRQPEAAQPTFYTLYFEEIDVAGHDFGPEFPQMRPAVEHVDQAMARLARGLETAGLTTRTNLVVVSDHGMAQNAQDRVIFLEDYVPLTAVEVIDWGPILSLAPRSGSVNDLYQALRDKHPAMKVFKSEDLPARYRLAGHPRYPPLIGIADDGWEITSRERLARDKNGLGGDHGYDPINQSMHGLFIATGPAFREGMKVPRFENVHVYELLCRVLGIRPQPNDGDPKVTAAFFR